MKKWFERLKKSGWLTHALRSAVATSISLAVARLFEMPQPYWAGVTTMIVTQSTLGDSWKVARHRLLGTAIGAVAGGLLAKLFPGNLWAFALTIFLLGIVCGTFRLDVAAYRFAGVALIIVSMVGAGKTPPFTVAFDRFAEVSIGILVALLIVAVWPSRELKST